MLGTLCTCPVVSHEEVLHFIESNHLMGLGLGYIDVHLLASARLSDLPLWPLDCTLQTAAVRLKLAWQRR